MTKNEAALLLGIDLPMLVSLEYAAGVTAAGQASYSQHEFERLTEHLALLGDSKGVPQTTRIRRPRILGKALRHGN